MTTDEPRPPSTIGPAGICGASIVVTGAASGIGAAVARRLAEAGARLTLVDQNADAVQWLAASLPCAIALATDVSTTAGVDTYIAASVATYGGIAGVHLNAGYDGAVAPFAQSDPEEYEKLMAVNARGVFLGIRAAVLQMLSQGGGGKIVVTASTAGMSGSQGMGLYSASKHAAIGLVRAAALDHSADGIRVNALCPGETDTPMLERALRGYSAAADGTTMTKEDLAIKVPIGRLGRPDELASAAAWLLSDESSYVTGAALAVDGGLTAGRYAARR